MNPLLIDCSGCGARHGTNCKGEMCQSRINGADDLAKRTNHAKNELRKSSYRGHRPVPPAMLKQFLEGDLDFAINRYRRWLTDTWYDYNGWREDSDDEPIGQRYKQDRRYKPPLVKTVFPLWVVITWKKKGGWSVVEVIYDKDPKPQTDGWLRPFPG